MRGWVEVEPPSRVVQLGARTKKTNLLTRLTRLTAAWEKLRSDGKAEIQKHRRYERTQRTELSTGNN